MDIIINGVSDDCPSGASLLPTQGNYWLNILHVLDSHNENPALGDFLRRLHQLDGQWIVASPIHWEATHNDAMIVAMGQELGLSDDKARNLYLQVKQFLEEDGCSVYYHDAHLWLLNPSDKPKLQSQFLPRILHHSLLPILKNMGESLYWQRLFTEMQMLFSASSIINQNNETNVNGLWFYGEGEFHFPGKKRIFSNDVQLVSAFPQTIMNLDLQCKLDKNTVICLQNQQALDALLDKAKKKGLAVRCYWNNMACQITKQNVLIRLWRSLIHANKKKNDC